MRSLFENEMLSVVGGAPANGSSAAMGAASAVDALSSAANAVDTLITDAQDFMKGVAGGIWDAL